MSNAANLAANNRFKATSQAKKNMARSKSKSKEDLGQASNPSFLNALQ